MIEYGDLTISLLAPYPHGVRILGLARKVAKTEVTRVSVQDRATFSTQSLHCSRNMVVSYKASWISLDSHRHLPVGYYYRVEEAFPHRPRSRRRLPLPHLVFTLGAFPDDCACGKSDIKVLNQPQQSSLRCTSPKDLGHLCPTGILRHVEH